MSQSKADLKKLQKEWYAKLKREGFNDIEHSDGRLKSFVSQQSSYYHNQGQNLETKIEYYRRASHFVHDHKFATPLEKQIWIYHSEGMSARTISKLLKGKIGKTIVNDTVRQLAKLMIEKYIK